MTKAATIQEANAKVDAIQDKMNALTSFIGNQVSTLRRNMSSFIGMSHDGKRDIYDIYGYPKSLAGDVGFRLMFQMANRAGIGHRLTHGMAHTCWRDGFEVYAGTEKDDPKILEDEIGLLFKSGLIEKLEAVDALNRIGRLSVLLVGVPDGQEDLKQPLGTVPGNGADMLDKLYYIPYAYDEVEITGQVEDHMNPRYGLPEFYTLSRMANEETKDNQVKSLVVHYTRVIHLAEGKLSSDIEGYGALEPIFNQLLDINKTIGGSSEAYFRNAKRILAYEIGEKFATSLQDPKHKASFQEGAEKFVNEGQDFAVAVGGTVKSLDATHESPLDTVKVALWTISAQSGYPSRVLTGEGSGQLAGSEDKLTLNQIIADRQRGFCAPVVVVRLFEILEMSGMLKPPPGYEIRFPVEEAATEEQKNANANKKAETILKLVTAKSAIGGDGLDIRSAFDACDLVEVKVDEPEIEDLENPDDPGAPGAQDKKPGSDE